MADTVAKEELQRWFILSSWRKLGIVSVGMSVGHFLD